MLPKLNLPTIMSGAEHGDNLDRVHESGPVVEGGGLVAVGCLTLFFSSRRRFFLRIFVPRDELPTAMRALLEPTYTQGMRRMGGIQVAIGLLLVSIAPFVGQ